MAMETETETCALTVGQLTLVRQTGATRATEMEMEILTEARTNPMRVRHRTGAMWEMAMETEMEMVTVTVSAHRATTPGTACVMARSSLR